MELTASIFIVLYVNKYLSEFKGIHKFKFLNIVSILSVHR